MNRSDNVVLNAQMVGVVGFGPALAALKLRKLFAYFGSFGAILYVLSVSHSLYGTHADALTALCVFLLGIAGLSGGISAWFTQVRDCLFAIVLGITIICLLELATSNSALETSAVGRFFVSGTRRSTMGAAPTLTLLMLSIGVLMRHRLASGAIIVILTSLTVPFMSILAFSYGNNGIFFMMPLALSLTLFALGAAELLAFVRAPLLRPFLTTSSWGRMARLQVFCLILGAWTIGLVVESYSQSVMAVAAIVGMLWLFLVTMLSTGFIFEQIDRKRRLLERDMKRKANFDPLTGLWNRRAVRDMQLFDIASDGKRRVSTCEQVGVILADVDMFKRINDISGHDEGDRVLREISRVLRDRVRGFDVVARWGGEEFLILLPNLTTEKTMEMAQVLRAAIASSVDWNNKGRREAVTLSLGVTALNKDAGRTLELAIQDADEALFTAKSLGRNRVLLFGDEMPSRAVDLVAEFTSKRALH
jgi:diguanylate cyclase (GGDEF)-like protein